MLSLLSVGGVWGVFLQSHHRPYAHLPHVSHCGSFDPRDRRRFFAGLGGGPGGRLGPMTGPIKGP